MFGSALQWFQWRGKKKKKIIIADEARASNDDSVTAVSFLICRIRLWHAPSQDGGNLFICAEERGKGGQLASTIRQPSDKQYITAWDSQTNERGRRNVCSGWTEFCNHPATLITCIALDTRSLYSRTLRMCNSHTLRLPHRPVCCHTGSGLLKGTPVMSNVILQKHRRYISCMHFTVIRASLHAFKKVLLFLSFKVDQSNLEDILIRCANDHDVWKKITKTSTNMIFPKSSVRERISFYQRRQSQSQYFSPLFARLYLTGCQV